LIQSGYEEYIKKVRLISTSKVLIGRMVAEKVIETHSKIPEEYVRIIDSL